MSLTVIAFIAAGFSAVVMLIGVIFSTGNKPRDSIWSYVLATLGAGFIVGSLVLAISSLAHNEGDSKRAWQESCFANGGEVVRLPTGNVCLEPGYRFVDIPAKY